LELKFHNSINLSLQNRKNRLRKKSFHLYTTKIWFFSGIFTSIFLHHNFCIFYNQNFWILNTRIFVFFIPKFLHFLHQNFCIFWTKIFDFFTSEIFDVLHQNFWIFIPKFLNFYIKIFALFYIKIFALFYIKIFALYTNFGTQNWAP